MVIDGTWDSNASPVHQFLSLGKALRDRLNSPLIVDPHSERLKMQWGALGWAAVRGWDEYVLSGYKVISITAEEIERLKSGKARELAVDMDGETDDGAAKGETEEARTERLRRHPSIAETEEHVDEHTQAEAQDELAELGIKVRDFAFTGPHSKCTAFGEGVLESSVKRMEVLVRDEDIR
jgi:hypothetical protein